MRHTLLCPGQRVDDRPQPREGGGQARGVDATARAFARLGIAVTRGLLLDLLATGDRDGVDAAMEHWIALNAPLFEAASPAGEGSRSA